MTGVQTCALPISCSGELDPPEQVDPNHIVVIEGLHPMYDERVRELLDFSVYLDISDEVKIAWKIQDRKSVV